MKLNVYEDIDVPISGEWKRMDVVLLSDVDSLLIWAGLTKVTCECGEMFYTKDLREKYCGETCTHKAQKKAKRLCWNNNRK